MKKSRTKKNVPKSSVRGESSIPRISARKQVVVAFSVVLLVVGVFALSRCILDTSCDGVARVFSHHTTVHTKKGDIRTVVVDTPKSREKGLSGKKGLASGSGMLFVFDTPGRYGFWMKDMTFPIDIVWINDDGLVVHIERNVSPDSYPQAYINTLEATYVLELGANESEKYGLYMGAHVDIGN